MFDRNTWIMYGILALVLFFGGFIIGYVVWGAPDDETVDYKVMLRDAADYVAKLENDNMALSRTTKAAAEEPEIKPAESKPAETESIEPTEAASPEPTEAASPEPAEAADSAKEIQEQADALASQNAAIMAALASEKDMAQKHLVLTEQIQAVMESQKELQEENARLQSVIAEKDSLVAELEQSKAAAEACMAEKEQLTLAKAELEANISQNQALIDQNESLHVQLKKMTGEVEAMRSRLVEIQSLAGAEQGSAPEPAPSEQPQQETQEKPAE